MLNNLKARVLKNKIWLAAPVILSVFALSGSMASASLGPVSYNSTDVTFTLPGTEPAGPGAVIWQLTLWHDGTMEGRETGTPGQTLTITVPSVNGCNFQIDARNLTISPNVITYSARPVIANCGQSDE